MSTTETEQKPAEQLTPAALQTVETVSEQSLTDASTLVDRNAYVDAFRQLTEGLVSTGQARNLFATASELGARANMAIRLAIRNAKDAPDFAGATSLYAFAYGTCLDRFAKENNLSEADVKAYRDNIRYWMSDNRLVQSEMALYAAQNDSKVKTSTADVRKLVSERGKLTADLKKGIERLATTQTTPKGKPLNPAVDPAKITPTFGPQPKVTRAPVIPDESNPDSVGNVGQEVPTKSVEILLGVFGKAGQPGGLTLPIAADTLHHLADSLVWAILGPMNEKVPQRAGRKAALDTIAALQRELSAMQAVIEGKAQKESVQEHSWKEQ